MRFYNSVNSSKYYRYSCLLISIIFVFYFVLLFLIDLNLKTFVVNDLFGILLLFLLFICNCHIMLTLIGDKNTFGKCFQSFCRFSVFDDKFEIKREIVFLLISAVFISLYAYALIHDSYSDKSDPLLSVDMDENPYQIYSGAEDPLQNTTFRVHSVMDGMSEIKSVIKQIYFNINSSGRLDRTYQNKYDNLSGNFSSVITYTHSNVTHLEYLEKKLKLYSDIPPEFGCYGINKSLKYSNYTDIEEFEGAESNISIYSWPLYKSYLIAKLLCDYTNNTENISDETISILYKEMYGIYLVMYASSIGINKSVNDIDLKIRPFQNPSAYSKVNTIAKIFDVTTYLISIIISILFLFNFSVIVNRLYCFIKNISLAHKLRFNTSEDFDCIRDLRRIKEMLNNYILYFMIVLVLSMLIYVLVKNNTVNGYYSYIEATLISTYTFIILIFSSMAFRKISTFVQNSVDTGMRHIDRISLCITDYSVFERLDRERTLLKSIAEEFSIHKNLLSYLPILAPVATIIITLWVHN
jgi:hypothetical protein